MVAEEDDEAAMRIVPPAELRIYPCDRCGAMRTKSEGGSIFTLCGVCWGINPPASVEAK
jgi:hypothetical protein